MHESAELFGWLWHVFLWLIGFLWAFFKFVFLWGSLVFVLLFVFFTFHPVFLRLCLRASRSAQRGEFWVAHFFGLLRLGAVVTRRHSLIVLNFGPWSKILHKSAPKSSKRNGPKPPNEPSEGPTPPSPPISPSDLPPFQPSPLPKNVKNSEKDISSSRASDTCTNSTETDISKLEVDLGQTSDIKYSSKHSTSSETKAKEEFACTSKAAFVEPPPDDLADITAPSSAANVGAVSIGGSNDNSNVISSGNHKTASANSNSFTASSKTSSESASTACSASLSTTRSLSTPIASSAEEIITPPIETAAGGSSPPNPPFDNFPPSSSGSDGPESQPNHDSYNFIKNLQNALRKARQRARKLYKQTRQRLQKARTFWRRLSPILWRVWHNSRGILTHRRTIGQLKIGFPEPHLTGVFAGLFYQAQAMFFSNRTSIHLITVFPHTAFAGRIQTDMRINPWRIIYIILTLLLDREVWSAASDFWCWYKSSCTNNA